jgi:hemolysin D
MPAPIALADRLPRPVPLRRAVLLGSMCLLIALIWAAVTRVEVVVTAPATARAEVGNAELRAPGPHIVADIHVREGERVTRGQLIAEFDSDRVETQWQAARAALAARRRALADDRAVLGVIDEGRDAVTLAPRVRLRLREHRAGLARLDGELASLAAEAQAAGARAEALQALLAVQAERRRAVDAAAAKGAMSGFDVLRTREDHLVHQTQLYAVEGLLQAAGHRHQAQRHARLALQSSFRRRLHEAIDSAEVEVLELRGRLTELAQRRREVRVTAPVDAVVHRLHVAAGAFVTQGDALGVLVPEDPELIFETRLAPGQRAFVRQGQACRLKLDALPFARYGALPCTVAALDLDVAESDRGPAHYRVKVRPSAQQLYAEGERVQLQAGATAWVDVIAGQRTVLSFVTEPLWRFTRESLREW